MNSSQTVILGVVSGVMTSGLLYLAVSLRHEMKIGSFQVSIDTKRDNALFVVNRNSLHDFVETEKQEEAITEFLNIGFNEIVKNAAITNIIKKYISLDE